MTNESFELKHFTMRLPKEYWLFLKSRSAIEEIPMSDIILKLLAKYKSRCDNRSKKNEVIED